MTLRAYLDNNATTRLAPEVLNAMMPFLTEVQINASSAAGELMGSARPIADAKRALAHLFGAPDVADNFVLTSGASEANSWAVHAATLDVAPGHIVASAIEHPSLIAALEARVASGWDVDFIKPDEKGRVRAEDFAARLRPATLFATCMLANNETGVVQPVEAIGRFVRERAPQALFHVDATQAVGRIPLSLDEMLADVDLLSLSAHKFHGPKGVGALYAAEGVHLPPLIFGAQENGKRGGTYDVASAAGLAAAARLAARSEADIGRLERLRDDFEARLRHRVPEIKIIGEGASRLPNTSLFLLPHIDAQDLIERLAMEGIVVAAGSACTSGAIAPSHVLLEMGIAYEEAKWAIRVSLAHDTSEEELALVLGHLGAPLPADS
jgi:cysteine desulfurase